MGLLAELDDGLRQRLEVALTERRPNAAKTLHLAAERYGLGDESQAKKGTPTSWTTILDAEEVLLYLPQVVVDAELEPPLQKELLDALRDGAAKALLVDNDRKRHFLSYASEDGAEFARVWRRELDRADVFVFMAEEMESGKIWRPELIYQLLIADYVHVAWTAGAKRSNWVRWEVEFSKALNRMETGKAEYDENRRPRIKPRGSGSADSSLVGEFNVVPETYAGAVHWSLTGAMLLSLTMLVWYPTDAILLRVWLSILSAIGLLLVGLHYLRSRWRKPLQRRFVRAAHWLQDAPPYEKFALSKKVLERIYGPKLLTRRGIITSFIMTVALSLPALLVIYRSASESTLLEIVNLRFNRNSLVLGILGTFAMDFTSLAITKKIVTWLAKQRPLRWKTMLLGLLVDVAVVFLLSITALIRTYDGSNYGLDVLTGRRTAFLEAHFVAFWQMMTGQLRLENMLDTPFPTFFIIGVLWVGSTALPSLLHATLLIASKLLQAGQWTQRAIINLIGVLVDDIRGPTGFAYVGMVLLTGLAALGSFSRSTTMKPDDPRWAPLRTTSAKEQCMLTHEVTQSWWHTVVSESWHAQQMGLPREPATFRGWQRPVETVSWCETLRFINAWSHMDGRDPAYCEIDHDVRACAVAAGTWNESYTLPGCEEGVPIASDDSANGYRLPTDREWWNALVNSHPKGAWLTANAGFRTHEVVPDGEFVDLLGNVAEWIESDEGLRAVDREARGQIIGGSWFDPLSPREISTALVEKRRHRERLPNYLVRAKTTYFPRSARYGFRVVMTQRGEKCER